MRVLRLIIVAWFAVLANCMFQTDASAQTQGVWKLVAQSDYVVVGELATPSAELQALQRSGRQAYVELPVSAVVVLKGAPLRALRIRHYAGEAPYRPSNGRLMELASRRAIMFLVQVDGGNGGVYFAGYSPDAIVPASPEMEGSVRREIDRQAQVVRAWRADPGLPHFENVRLAIERVAALKPAGGETARAIQAREFRRIEELGMSAVPAIVALMDDRRRLAFRQISLVNRAVNAFEGTRHYGPEQMVDALSAILNELTGEDFRTIHNGGTERERAAAVTAWRIYASRLVEERN